MRHLHCNQTERLARVFPDIAVLLEGFVAN